MRATWTLSTVHHSSWTFIWARLFSTSVIQNSHTTHTSDYRVLEEKHSEAGSKIRQLRQQWHTGKFDLFTYHWFCAIYKQFFSDLHFYLQSILFGLWYSFLIPLEFLSKTCEIKETYATKRCRHREFGHVQEGKK